MNKRKVIVRTASVLLAGTMVLDGGAQTILAAAPSEKEEVVYAILDASGEVTGVYVVNSFAGGDIVDYGDYTNVRNLTTGDKITVDGDEITFHTEADKVYYQGDLKTTDIPWNISVRYYMDGTEYSAQEIAGMSGSLEIKISITENTNCDERFWDGYALQAALTLDTEKCKNIAAENATVANVGANKQLSYIILPGKGAELSITADVSDFEMDAISINGVKLNMELDMDEEELTDKFGEIQDAVAELDDGAIELSDGALTLSDGAGELSDGGKSLLDGTVELSDGAEELSNGVASLNDGIAAVQTALDTLNSQSATLTGGSKEVLTALRTIQNSLDGVAMDAGELSNLAAASTQIKGGIDSLVSGLGTVNGTIDSYYASLAAAGISDVNAYAAQHEQAVQALGITATQRALYGAYVSGGDAGVMAKLQELASAQDAEAVTLYQQYAQSSDAGVITSYVVNAGKLIQVETLLAADASYIYGSNAVIAGIDAALDPQSGQLMTGAAALQSSYAQYDAVIQQMSVSLGSLTENMTALKNGIDTLTANYETLDAGINNYTSAVAQIREGYGKIYAGAASLADGTTALGSGITSLKDGAQELYDGTVELYDGSVELYDGTVELTDGTGEFRSETEDIDTEISDTISDTVDEMTGKDVETVSFVSEKNTNVESVLFVIKTDAIEIPEEEETPEAEVEEKSIWQKFLGLFGME